jgi:multimeric flavodoxin WrbA
MKITAVLGSPNRNGNTAALVARALAGAREAGAETELIFLKDYRIEYCLGCLSNGAKEYCMSSGRCNIPDDAEKLKTKLYGSDGIIFASPSYGIEPTARMKNFLTDRIGMFTVYTSGLAGKYFAGISTAGGIGAAKVAKRLSREFAAGFFDRGYVSGSLGVLVGDGSVRELEGELEKAYRLGTKLAEDIRHGRRYPLQLLGKRILTRLMIRPIISKNILAHKDHTMKAVYENLTGRGYIS